MVTLYKAPSSYFILSWLWLLVMLHFVILILLVNIHLLLEYFIFLSFIYLEFSFLSSLFSLTHTHNTHLFHYTRIIPNSLHLVAKGQVANTSLIIISKITFWFFLSHGSTFMNYLSNMNQRCGFNKMNMIRHHYIVVGCNPCGSIKVSSLHMCVLVQLTL